MEYTIFEINDVSKKGAILYRLKVIIEYNANVKELEAMLEEIRIKLNKNIDALVIYLYDIGSEFYKVGSLGIIEYYPHCRVGKALYINMGGPSATKLNIEKYKKNFQTLPNAYEYKVFSKFVELVDKYGSRDEVPIDKYDQFLDINSYDELEIDRIIEKCLNWFESRDVEASISIRHGYRFENLRE